MLMLKSLLAMYVCAETQYRDIGIPFWLSAIRDILILDQVVRFCLKHAHVEQPWAQLYKAVVSGQNVNCSSKYNI